MAFKAVSSVKKALVVTRRSGQVSLLGSMVESTRECPALISDWFFHAMKILALVRRQARANPLFRGKIATEAAFVRELCTRQMYRAQS